MSDKKQSLKKKCTILMVINIVLTFYIFGLPKTYENKLHYTADRHMIYSHSDVEYKLTSDYTATDLDGEEVVLKEGEFMIYVNFPVEDLEDYVSCQEHRFSVDILDEADCYDASEEYKQFVDEYNRKADEEGERDYILYRLANIFWFVVPGVHWIIEYPCGIAGGLIAFAFEKHRFKRLSKKEAYKRFIVTDAVIAAIIITLTVIYQIFPITCR